MDSNYQRIYGVGLIDDIHNFFPDILYNPGRFSSAQDLTHYISNNVRERFNLFDRAAAAAAPAPPVPTPAPMPISTSPPPVQRSRVTAPTYMTTPFTNSSIRLFSIPPLPPRYDRAPGDRIARELFAQLDQNSAALAHLLELTAPMVSQEPVRVGLNAEQISTGTRQITISDITTDTTCAICMETIESGNVCRRLNHCNHLFHEDCIMQHFQTNVRCPLCRHDVRDP
jgi:predicted transcriptional regulator